MSGFRKLSQTFCIANIIWYSCRPIFLVKIRLAVIRQGVFACFILSKASIAKVHAAEVAVMVTNKAMELMGLYGYVRDYNVEKYWRDCKIMQLWEGGAQLGRFDVCRGYFDCKL